MPEEQTLQTFFCRPSRHSSRLTIRFYSRTSCSNSHAFRHNRNYAWVTWMTVNSIWPSVQDKRAEQGDVRGIILLQCIPGQVLLWILRSLPAFIVAYYGPSLVQTVMGALPTWVMAGLNTVGKALPAIGIAMLIKYMARKELIPFLP